MKGLILHAGARQASIEQVTAVQTPQATQTWQPIPHITLLQLVVRALTEYGLRVASEQHALFGKNGERYFGVLQLANGNNPEDYAITLGLRNSHDQTFPAAGAIGSHVFVCDNLAFSGEITFGRKHTSRIMDHLPTLTGQAVSRLIEKRGWQDARIKAYKTFEFEKDIYVHDFVVRALKQGVITTQGVEKVIQQWEQPAHVEFQPRTGWSLFNAFTEVLKGSVSMLQPRTLRLHQLMDKRVGIAEIRATHFGDQTQGPDVADFEIAERDEAVVRRRR